MEGGPAVGQPDGLVSDTDVLRDYGTYCGRVGDDVVTAASELNRLGHIPRGSWYGAGMTKLLTLQDNLDHMRSSYEACLVATVDRIQRIGHVLRTTDGSLHSVADEYDAADRRASHRIERKPQ